MGRLDDAGSNAWVGLGAALIALGGTGLVTLVVATTDHSVWLWIVTLAAMIVGALILLNLALGATWRWWKHRSEEPMPVVDPQAWAEAVVRLLEQRPRTEADLAQALGLRLERLEEAVEGLKARGVVEQDGTVIKLAQVTEIDTALPITVLETSPDQPSVVGPELRVAIEEQVWRRFINTQPMVLGLQLKLRITNLTEHEKHTTGAGIQAVDMLMAEEITDTYVEEPYKAWRHSKPRGIQGVIDPNDSVAGWFAYTFKHRPSGGTPAYTLTVNDDLGTAYVIEVPEHGPETYQG